MRGDLMFLVSLLSIASATILYIGSDNSYKYIYGTSESLKEKLRDRMHEVAPKCCEELTKECFACATGLLVEDFCKRHSGEYGCPVRVDEQYPNHTLSWRDCEPFTNSDMNRTEALYTQLKKVVHVLNKTNYIVGYGTLMGIIRDNSMNDNEVDNDIVVDKTFDPKSLKEELFKEGLIVFKYGIYRICNYSPTPKSNKSPWTGEYSIYTDIYNQLPHVFVDPEKPNTALTKNFSITQRKFRDIYVNVPDDQLIKKWFDKKYGNWKVPTVDGWKKNIKKKFK